MSNCQLDDVLSFHHLDDLIEVIVFGRGGARPFTPPDLAHAKLHQRVDGQRRRRRRCSHDRCRRLLSEVKRSCRRCRSR